MNDPNTMTMLYKVVDGSVQDQHYGASQSYCVPMNYFIRICFTYYGKIKNRSFSG